MNLEGFANAGLEGTRPLTIVEFTDYQCPFCQRFHATAFGELKKNYIDTGKVRFYSRDLPLDFHPNAMRAAEAARCATEQGQFWKLRDVMGANPDKLDMDSLVADAADLKMDVPAFRACVESEKYKNAVQTDVLEAMKIGADGTPDFRDRQEHARRRGWRVDGGRPAVPHVRGETARIRFRQIILVGHAIACPDYFQVAHTRAAVSVPARTDMPLAPGTALFHAKKRHLAPCLLFYLSGGHGLQAGYAGGNPAPNFWDDEAKALLSIRGSPPSQSAGCAIRRYEPAGRRPSLKTVDNCSCIFAGSGRAKILRTVSSTG